MEYNNNALIVIRPLLRDLTDIMFRRWNGKLSDRVEICALFRLPLWSLCKGLEAVRKNTDGKHGKVKTFRRKNSGRNSRRNGPQELLEIHIKEIHSTDVRCRAVTGLITFLLSAKSPPQ